MLHVHHWAGRAVVAVVLASTLVPAESPTGKTNATVLKQEAIGSEACGPCAIMNMSAFGSDELKRCVSALAGNTSEQRVQSLIEQYCSKPSVVYADKRSRYTSKHGLSAEDLADAVNEFLASKGKVRVAGAFLDRFKDEQAEKHLRRIWSLFRKSLDAGVPPIVEIRSYAARPKGSEFKWEGLKGHFVVVTEIDPIGEGEKGFRYRFADSYTGQVETGYIAVEEARNFSATKRFSTTPDDVEHYEWITDYPYLLVYAPSLRLSTQKESWQTRTIIAMRHAVVEKSSFPPRKR